MTEAINRNFSQQSPYGYKQLPGLGPAGGADLKSTVCAGIGVALGIVMGTLLASGFGSTANPAASHASVRITPNITASANLPVTASAKPPIVATGPAVAATGQTPPLQHHAATQGSPQLSVALKSALAQNSAPAKTFAKTFAVRNVSVAHKHRSARMLAAIRRRLARRRAHSRHRRHFSLKASVIAKPPPKIQELESEPDHAQEVFAFTVEGDATQASYNESAGLIETYEGMSFVLDQTASVAGVIALQDYPANIHYRCNQSGNCTLVRAGAVVLNAMRINQIALVR